MATILVIDDEPTLRSSMARGLAKLDDVEVYEAGDLGQAVLALDAHAPDVIVSDIDLPDRSGLELLGELGRRGLNVPVIFVSAYLKAFRAQIPKHGNFEAREKPVPLNELRELVKSKLEQDEAAAPFSVADYLQLSAMGHHSVRIVAEDSRGVTGQLIVHQGQPYAAQMGALVGTQAFGSIAFRTDLQIKCLRLLNPEVEQNLHGTMDALLMDAARMHDEMTRDQDQSVSASASSSHGSDGTSADDSMESASLAASPDADSQAAGQLKQEQDSLDRMFERHWEAGVDALLSKDYWAALEAFETAQAIRPHDTKVAVNIQRLKELGIERNEEASA